IMHRRQPAVMALAFVAAALAIASSSVGQTIEGALYFDQTSDTIQVATGTDLGTSATFEARILLPTGSGAGGRVFNEWTPFQEDKLLFVDPTGIQGYVHPINLALLVAAVAISTDVWHHIAYVHDTAGNEQRIY